MADSGVPAPPANLATLVRIVPWPKGQEIHRCHLKIYGSINPGKGNARFSPIKASDGSIIPTLYGGTGFDCAAMETVFHDVPFAVGPKIFDKQKLVDHVHSQIIPKRDLNLADLSATALRNLGIQRNQLIDTEKNTYPATRKWAEAVHAASPSADGLCWISRQDDRALAIMLFGDRVAATDLAPANEPRGVLDDMEVFTDLLVLADRIGVNIVDGN